MGVGGGGKMRMDSDGQEEDGEWQIAGKEEDEEDEEQCELEEELANKIEGLSLRALRERQQLHRI